MEEGKGEGCPGFAFEIYGHLSIRAQVRTLKILISGPRAAGMEKSDLTLPFLNALTKSTYSSACAPCSLTTKSGHAGQQ